MIDASRINTTMNFRRAFTLIEILVSISIVGLLSSIIIVSVNAARLKANFASGQQFGANVYHSLGDSAVVSLDFESINAGTTPNAADSSNPGLLANWYGAVTANLVSGVSGMGMYIKNPSLLYLSLSNYNLKDFTASFWFKPISIATFGPGYEDNGNSDELYILSANNGSFRVVLSPNGQIQIYQEYGGTPFFWITCPQKIVVNTFYNITETMSSGSDKKFTAYLNGQKCGSSGDVALPTSMSWLSLNYLSFNQGSENVYDQVRLFTRSFLASEVQQIYADGPSKHLADAK